MTIEQYIKPLLEEEINHFFEDYTAEVCLDISYANLSKIKPLIVQIKTGTSQLSTIAGVTEMTTPTQVYFKCLTNDQQEVLERFSNLINSMNANTYQTTDNSLNIKFTFATPSIIATQNESVNNDTVSVSYGMFVVTTYATNLSFEKSNKTMVIDGVNYSFDTEPIAYSTVANYVYNYSPTNRELGRYEYDNKNITISFTLIKSDLLSRYLSENKGILEDKLVTLNEVDGNVKHKYVGYLQNINEVETSGVPQISATLIVVSYKKG